jgi:hypothetical protein
MPLCRVRVFYCWAVCWYVIIIIIIIDHITSGCPILAKNGYLMRHDKVCAHFEMTDKWYTHTEKLQQIGQM